MNRRKGYHAVEGMIKCECKQGLLEASDISHITPAELFQLVLMKLDISIST